MKKIEKDYLPILVNCNANDFKFFPYLSSSRSAMQLTFKLDMASTLYILDFTRRIFYILKIKQHNIETLRSHIFPFNWLQLPHF